LHFFYPLQNRLKYEQRPSFSARFSPKVSTSIARPLSLNPSSVKTLPGRIRSLANCEEFARKKLNSILEEEMIGMTILCVEDQSEYMHTLTCMLEGIGYEVMPAGNGGQAMDQLANRAIDGVLLGYNLPDADGTTLRAQLKAIRPDVPDLLFKGIGGQTPLMIRFFDS
jgi:CheY-like chemotaxis protein